MSLDIRIVGCSLFLLGTTMFNVVSGKPHIDSVVYDFEINPPVYKSKDLNDDTIYTCNHNSQKFAISYDHQKQLLFYNKPILNLGNMQRTIRCSESEYLTGKLKEDNSIVDENNAIWIPI